MYSHKSEFEFNGRDVGPYETEDFGPSAYGAIGRQGSSWAYNIMRDQKRNKHEEQDKEETGYDSRFCNGMFIPDLDSDKPQILLNAPHPHGIPTPQWLYHPDPDYELPPGLPEAIHPQVLSYCTPVYVNDLWLYMPLRRIVGKHFYLSEPINL